MVHNAAHHMTDEDRNRIAHDKYGKSYDDLDDHERRSVIGTFANIAKRMGQEAGQEAGQERGQERVKEQGHGQEQGQSQEHEKHVTAGHHITDEDRDRIAQEKYGKPYDRLDAHERRSVGATFAAMTRRAAREEEEEQQ